MAKDSKKDSKKKDSKKDGTKADAKKADVKKADAKKADAKKDAKKKNGKAGNPAVETVVERVRTLNERALAAARQGGKESLQAYENLLQNVAEAQEAAGDRGADWIQAFARAQASFTRDLAESFPTLLTDLAQRARELLESVAGKAREVPGVAQVEGAAAGAVARESEMPIADYDDLSVAQIGPKLQGLSQEKLATVEAYEIRTKNRKTVLSKIAALQKK